MYIQKNKCRVFAKKGNDAYGQSSFEPKARNEGCSIVKILARDVKTSVRADSSASRGNAHELLYDAVILFGRRSPIKIGDVVEVNGFRLEVMTLMPRYDIDGDLDHIQCDLQIWSAEEPK